MAHWVYRFEDGSFLGPRRAPQPYASREETREGSMDHARVFNSPSAAANAGNYPGKYASRGEPRGEALRVTLELDPK